MAGDFDERMAELAEMVGDGHLVAKQEVDQVYARYQHEDISYHRDGTPSGTLTYHNGGGAKYLGRPWIESQESMMKLLADGLLEPGGLHAAARHIADEGTRMVLENAPVEFGDLRDSGHASVIDNGEVVYDRPPIVPRLSDAELKEKGHLRNEFGEPVAR